MSSKRPRLQRHRRICRFRRLQTERLEDRRLLSATDPRGLSSQWYDGVFDNSVEAQRIDQEISFRWGEGGPGLDVASDFSARWTGTLTPPRDDRYVFTILKSAGDQVGLRINGTEVINAQAGTSASVDSVSGTIQLTGDEPVAIELEYTNPDGEARVELRWKGNATPDQVVPVRYLSNDAKEILQPGVIREVYDAVNWWDFRGDYDLRQPTAVQISNTLNTNWIDIDGSEQSDNTPRGQDVSVYQEGILRPIESGWYQIGVDAVGNAEFHLSLDGRDQNYQRIAATNGWVYHHLYQHPDQISEPIYLEAGRSYPFFVNSNKYNGQVESRFHWRMVSGPDAQRHDRETAFEFIPDEVLFQSKPTVSLTPIQSQAGIGEFFYVAVNFDRPMPFDVPISFTSSSANTDRTPSTVVVPAFSHGVIFQEPLREMPLGETMELRLIPEHHIELASPSSQALQLTRTDPKPWIKESDIPTSFTRSYSHNNTLQLDTYFEDDPNEYPFGNDVYRMSQTVVEEKTWYNRLVWNHQDAIAATPGYIELKARALDGPTTIQVWWHRDGLPVPYAQFDITEKWNTYELFADQLVSSEVWVTLNESNRRIEVSDIQVARAIANPNNTGMLPKLWEGELLSGDVRSRANREAAQVRRTPVRTHVLDASGTSIPGATVELSLIKHEIDSHVSNPANLQEIPDEDLPTYLGVIDEYFTGTQLDDRVIGWESWDRASGQVIQSVDTFAAVGDLSMQFITLRNSFQIPDNVLSQIDVLVANGDNSDAATLLMTGLENYAEAIFREFGDHQSIALWVTEQSFENRSYPWTLLNADQIQNITGHYPFKNAFYGVDVTAASGDDRFDDVRDHPHPWQRQAQILTVDSSDPLPRPEDLQAVLTQAPWAGDRFMTDWRIAGDEHIHHDYLGRLISETSLLNMGLSNYSMISPGQVWSGPDAEVTEYGSWFFDENWVEGPAAKAWADLWLTEYADQSRMHTGVDGVAETRLMKGTYEVTVTLPGGETITKVIDTEDPALDTGLGMSVIPIVVNRRPVTATTHLAMSLGGRVSLGTASGEMVSDDHGSDQIVATVMDLPSHGRVIREGQPLAIGDAFLWQDLANGTIQYEQSIGVEIGSDRQDSFSFTVVDAMGLAAESPAQIVVDIDGRSPHQNWGLRYDVNQDQNITALDALITINHLNQIGDSSNRLPLPASRQQLTSFVDVTGDGLVTALDALQIINYLNQSDASAAPLAAESESVDPPSTFRLLPQPLQKSSNSRWSQPTVDDLYRRYLQEINPEPNALPVGIAETITTIANSMNFFEWNGSTESKKDKSVSAAVSGPLRSSAIEPVSMDQRPNTMV